MSFSGGTLQPSATKTSSKYGQVVYSFRRPSSHSYAWIAEEISSPVTAATGIEASAAVAVSAEVGVTVDTAAGASAATGIEVSAVVAVPAEVGVSVDKAAGASAAA